MLVAAGQVNQHVDDPADALEPAELMAESLRRASVAGGGTGLLEAADAVYVVHQLSWRYPDVGRLVAERLGASPRRVVESVMGGNLAGSMLNAAARAIQAGEADVVLLTGAEAWRSRNKARAAGVEPPWTVQPDDGPGPERFGEPTPLTSELEDRRGVTLPVHIYPLFEIALRAGLRLGVDAHRERLGHLWSAFSEVAAANPDAWIQRAFTPEEIAEPSPDNRMISFPYTKRLCSNNAVDMGAGLVLTSVAAAEAHGVPRDSWVFLHSGADAVDHWFVSNRADLRSSPAVRLAGRDALDLAGIGPDGLAHVDLYSCFPAAVQIAARELGLAPARAKEGGWGGVGASVPLTVTGGMAFAGGPWNNYTTHGVATMWRVLREDPGSTGLCTANGGYVTEHAMTVMSTEPPAAGTFRWSCPQAEVDALPRVEVDDTHTGPITVESYTVTHDREGRARALVAARTKDKRRTWCSTSHGDLLAAMEDEEFVGSSGMRTADGTALFDI